MIPGSKRNLSLSVVFHVVALGIFALLMGFSPKTEKITMIDMIDPGTLLPTPPSPPTPEPPSPAEPSEPPAPTPEPPTPPVVEPPTPEPPQPPEPTPPEPQVREPEPQPAPPEPPVQSPEPAPPAPVKKPKPKPPAPKPPEHKVRVSTNKVVKHVTIKNPSNDSKSSSSNNSSSFNPGTFAKNLYGKLGNSSSYVSGPRTGSGSSGVSSEISAYYSLIFQKMYSAWQPPFGADEGMCAPIIIRVEKNGMISKVSLASSSGNNEMDVSAVTAANRVKTLPPLPSGLGSDHADITVNFRIQR